MRIQNCLKMAMENCHPIPSYWLYADMPWTRMVLWSLVQIFSKQLSSTGAGVLGGWRRCLITGIVESTWRSWGWLSSTKVSISRTNIWKQKATKSSPVPSHLVRFCSYACCIPSRSRELAFLFSSLFVMSFGRELKGWRMYFACGKLGFDPQKFIVPITPLEAILEHRARSSLQITTHYDPKTIQKKKKKRRPNKFCERAERTGGSSEFLFENSKGKKCNCSLRVKQ